MSPGTRRRRVGAGLSVSPMAAEAAGEAAREARAALGAGAVDLAFLFLSPDHFAASEDALAALEAELAPQHLLGCVAEGVVAGHRELENGPAAAVWAASLPEAEVETFHSVAIETDDGVTVTSFPDLDGADLVALLVDPFSFPAAGFLSKLNEEEERAPVVGGLAAGGGEPVGRDAVITNAEGNVVFELAGEPALERLKADLANMTEQQQRSAANGGVLAGLVIDENRAEYRRGDYLMRGLMGVDEETGALAIAEAVRVGQTLRFHVRDAAAADEDLRENLANAIDGDHAAGALL